MIPAWGGEASGAGDPALRPWMERAGRGCRRFESIVLRRVSYFCEGLMSGLYLRQPVRDAVQIKKFPEIPKIFDLSHVESTKVRLLHQRFAINGAVTQELFRTHGRNCRKSRQFFGPGIMRNESALNNGLMPRSACEVGDCRLRWT